MKFIIKLIARHKGMFFTAIFFLSLEALSDLLQPTLMSHIVDDGIKYQNTKVILYYGASMFGIAAIGAFSAIMRNLYACNTSQLIGKELRSDLYRKVQSLSFDNIDQLQTGSIITRITNDVTQIQNFINGCMRILIKAPITCIGAIALIIIQTPKQLPMLLIILAISSVLIAGNMLMGYPRFGRLQLKLDKLNSVSREFLSSIRVVKSFGRESFEETRFGDSTDQLADASTSAMRITSIYSPLIQLTVNLGIVILLWLGGTTNTQNIGKLMASVNYMTQVLFALGMVSNILNMAVRSSASSKRVNEVLTTMPTQKEVLQATNITITGSIDFRDVSFTYTNSGKPALQHISFSVDSGETIGIIGSTGCGKTTLVNLVPRFYDVTEGSLYIDGVNVNDLTIANLRNSIGIVTQKPLLFSGSIRDNLLWGDPNANDAQIQEAAKAASADSFISSFSDGYGTKLGQGGVNLSGGQKQRLSIARALLRHPKILILDDCTSALDATTEASVLNAIRSNTSNMTVLLISQRISTVMKADRVLCLDDGLLVGYGTHQHLMETCDIYREIYKSQIGGNSFDA